MSIFSISRFTVVAIALTFIVDIKGAETWPKFFGDDPIAVEPETQDASNVAPEDRSVLRSAAQPICPAGLAHWTPRAECQFHRRSSRFKLVHQPNLWPARSSIEEAVRGRRNGKGPAPGHWMVIRAKAEGAAPGLLFATAPALPGFSPLIPKAIRKSNWRGRRREQDFWTLGYYQAEYYLAELDRNNFRRSECDFYTPSGRNGRMTLQDIQPVLEESAAEIEGILSGPCQPVIAGHDPRWL